MRAAGGRLWLAACALLILFGFAYGLDGYPLLDPDEGRNAEVAREMAERNDYVLPRLNNLPYVDKPVGFFAAAALAMEVLGPRPWAARIPPLLCTVGTLVLLGWFGRRLFGPEAGWIAAVAAGASPLTLAFARTVIPDATLTLWVTLALLAFYEAAEGRIAEWWSALAWASLALGALTKGPVAVALPLMVAIPYAGWRRAWRAVFDPVGILLFAALVLPWVRAVAGRVPGFLHYVFVTETFERLTTPALQRTGPWWYFLPILLAGALPWSAAALAGTRRIRDVLDHRVAFLLLWILVPLLFFSLSQSKRPQYVLPLVPAVALLTGGLWSRQAVAAAGLTLTGLGTYLIVGRSQIPAVLTGLSPAVAEAIPATAVAIGAACAAAGVAACCAKNHWERALLALALPLAGVPVASGKLMRAIGADRSAAALAASVVPALGAPTEVVAVRAYPPSLPFYMRRTLVVSTDSGRELTSNYLIRDLKRWRDAPGSPLRPGNWWREAALTCDRPRVFVIRSSDAEARALLARRLPSLAETPKYAAYGPCGGTDLALPEVRTASAPPAVPGRRHDGISPGRAAGPGVPSRCRAVVPSGDVGG